MRSLNNSTREHIANATTTGNPQFDSAAYAAFRAVFDSSSEALLIVNQGGEIQTANRRAAELLQLTRDGAASRMIHDFLDGLTSDELRPMLRRGKTFAASAGSADGASVPRSPVRVTLRSILPVSQHLLLALEESWQSNTTAVQERHLEAELRTILDAIQPGVLILDLEGGIRWSNPSFAQLFGLEGLELEHIKKVEDLSGFVATRFRKPQVFSARWRAFLAGHRGPAHDDLETIGNPARLIERFSRTISDHGRPVGWLEIYSDVSDRRHTQSRMLQTEKMAGLGKVIAGIAHELNNPLTTIMGNIQLLLGGGLQPGAASEARRIYQEADRARRIVKNLLYFARENKPDRSVVDLNEIVERTMALRGYEWKMKNIRAQTHLAADLPRTMADPYQLQQVVLNLLINAEHALENRDRGLVKIHTWWSEGSTGARLFLEIADDGPGIPAEIASRIFDPFFTTKPPGTGTGLGLSIVYGIIRQHDGEIILDGKRNSGAKFVIELPVVEPPADISNRKSANVPEPDTRVRPSRILVVEDEPTVARLIIEVLQEEGHSATASLDGRDGLELLSKTSYDLVICDLHMPHIDGRLFFQALKRSRSALQRQILFITGDTLSPATIEFIERNHLPYLAKPFLVEELKRAVRQQLQTEPRLTKRARGKRAGARGVRRRRK